jgi:glutathione S-transferase
MQPDAHLGFEAGDEDDCFVMYGLSYSLFTGKLEAYFKNKGLPYRFVEMSKDLYRKTSIATGIVQLPCVQTPAGDWLTDTTAIMKHFEAEACGPPIRPEDPAVAFFSLLFEDLFDEWYWRPALYYRWAFDEDAKLLGSQLARTMFRELPLPQSLLRRFMVFRQRAVYLKKDGVTRETAPVIEALYLDTLRVLDGIFAERPFLFGDRPCEADYGLFGPFFRHFFCDPTAGWLMREHAPHLAHWVTRLWSMRPSDFGGRRKIAGVPKDLGFFFEMIANDYFPYLQANDQAVAAGQTTVRYRGQGVDWAIPVAPYRTECFNELKRFYATLDPEATRRVAELLHPSASDGLRRSTIAVEKRADKHGRIGRLGRPAQLFDG